LSNQTSWDTNRTTQFQFQNNLLETCVNTCYIIVKNTRLISVLFRLHAVSSRFLQNLWHSNGPEPKPSPLEVWQNFSHILLITTQRCDDTVEKKRVNSCVLKHLFLERVEQPKISPKNPGNALSDALLMSCFQNFAADAAKK